MFVDMQANFKTSVKALYDDDEDNNYNSSKQEETHKSCGDSSATMADNERANKSLCDIPYAVTLDLMNSMDTDGTWEHLAAEVDKTFDYIQQLRKKEQQNGSATRCLLWNLGSQNFKVIDLYEKLKSMSRLRDMKILEDYMKGGQESKLDKKKLESLLVSLPQQPNEVKATDSKAQRQMESGFSSGFNEINFNHTYSPNKNKADVAGSKNYEDKIIPGTNGLSLMQSISTYNNDFPLRQVDSVTSRNDAPSYYPLSVPSKHLNKENYKDTTLPQSVLPSLPNKQVPSNCGRQENFMNQSYPSSVKSNSKNSPITHTKMPLNLTAENIPCFSYRELHNATDGFSVKNLIGEGAFGQVYKGTIQHNDCAIKKLHNLNMDDDKQFEQFKNEVLAFHRYRHENILHFYGYTQESPFCLVYQFCHNGSLEDRLLRKNNTPSLTWERRLNILVGACKGLSFLHTRFMHSSKDSPLIHGDIKSANILLDQYFEAKLGDLGQAMYASSQSADSSGFTHITVAESNTKRFGTKAYLPNDLRSNFTQLCTKSDVYALGVVFLEVCSGFQAYDLNRDGARAFLADYFTMYIDSYKNESMWKETFQDTTLTNIPDDIFIDVLKLAARCVKSVKKHRIDSLKLLTEMKEIYRKNKEKVTDEGNTYSISSSLQIDSRNTISSCYTSTDNENQHGIKPYSSQGYVSEQQQSIRQEQQKKFDEFQSLKATKTELNTQHLVNHQTEQHTSVHSEDRIEMRNVQESGSPIHSFPPNTPIPEAFRLQAAYDIQHEIKRIDRLSGLSQDSEQIEEKSVARLSPIPQQENFPQADPKKLALLNAFDEANFPNDSPTEEFSRNLECDPVKIAFLQSFDDDVYKKTELKQTTASEASSAFYKTQTPLEQHLPVEGHSHTSSDNNEVRRPSDDSNIGCELTRSLHAAGLGEEAASDVKSGKLTRNDFFDTYFACKNNAVEDTYESGDEDETDFN